MLQNAVISKRVPEDLLSTKMLVLIQKETRSFWIRKWRKKSADVTLPEALKEFEHACYCRKWDALNLFWAINVLFITLGLQNKISCYFANNSTWREKLHWSVLFPLLQNTSHYSLEANCTAISTTSFPLEACKQSFCFTQNWFQVQAPTLCNPMDYSPPGCSIHGIFQERILQWVAVSCSRRSSQPMDWTLVIQAQIPFPDNWHF